MRILLTLFFLSALSCFAQSVKGTTSAVGQTATASLPLAPQLALAINFNCVQAPPFSLNPANLWAGAIFNCVVTANQPAPPTGNITVTLTATPPAPGSPGVPTAGVTLTVTPATVVIPANATSAPFVVKSP